MSLEEKQEEMQKLQDEINQIKEADFKKASKHWFTLLHAKYQSSSTRTNQYLTFCRVFKRQFKKLLNDNFDIVKIEISKPNHFDQNGFFELKNGNIYYFSIGDLRWNKCFLIRKAKDFQDYTGEVNQYCSVEDFDQFMKDLKNIVKNQEVDKNLYNFEHKKCGTGFFMATKSEAKTHKCNVCKKPFLEDQK